MKYYTLNPLSDACATVRLVAAELGVQLDIQCVEQDFLKSAEFKAMNQTDNLPLLVTAEGSL